jgi:hypothetical protein
MSEQEPHGPGPEGPPPREGEPVPFVRAARFGTEATAGRAYFAAQQEVFTAPACDLSIYRFLLEQVYHVAVLGDAPPRTLARRIERILAAGDAVTLPDEVLQQLAARRDEQIQQAPWSEGHYRPGRRL